MNVRHDWLFYALKRVNQTPLKVITVYFPHSDDKLGTSLNCCLFHNQEPAGAVEDSNRNTLLPVLPGEQASVAPHTDPVSPFMGNIVHPKRTGTCLKMFVFAGF